MFCWSVTDINIYNSIIYMLQCLFNMNNTKTRMKGKDKQKKWSQKIEKNKRKPKDTANSTNSTKTSQYWTNFFYMLCLLFIYINGWKEDKIKIKTKGKQARKKKIFLSFPFIIINHPCFVSNQYNNIRTKNKQRTKTTIEYFLLLYFSFIFFS